MAQLADARSKVSEGLKRVNMEEKSSETPVADRIPTRGQ